LEKEESVETWKKLLNKEETCVFSKNDSIKKSKEAVESK